MRRLPGVAGFGFDVGFALNCVFVGSRSLSALRCRRLGLILHPLEWICIQAGFVEHTIARSTFSIYLVVVKK